MASLFHPPPATAPATPLQRHLQQQAGARAIANRIKADLVDHDFSMLEIRLAKIGLALTLELEMPRTIFAISKLDDLVPFMGLRRGHVLATLNKLLQKKVFQSAGKGRYKILLNSSFWNVKQRGTGVGADDLALWQALQTFPMESADLFPDELQEAICALAVEAVQEFPTHVAREQPGDIRQNRSTGQDVAGSPGVAVTRGLEKAKPAAPPESGPQGVGANEGSHQPGQPSTVVRAVPACVPESGTVPEKTAVPENGTGTRKWYPYQKMVPVPLSGTASPVRGLGVSVPVVPLKSDLKVSEFKALEKAINFETLKPDFKGPYQKMVPVPENGTATETPDKGSRRLNDDDKELLAEIFQIIGPKMQSVRGGQFTNFVKKDHHLMRRILGEYKYSVSLRVAANEIRNPAAWMADLFYRWSE